jgi:hypothetical protein
MASRNKYAKELWQDKRYMKKVCKNKKERKHYEKVLKRMDKEYKETFQGYLDQYERD